MDLEKRMKFLEEKVEELEEKTDAYYDDISNIMGFLRTKHPDDFLPGGQFKPGLFLQK